MSRPWLDMMPQLELRSGVPVVDAAGNAGSARIVLATGHEIDDGRAAASLWDGASLSEVFFPLDELRVDLEDPIGFAYALHEIADLCNRRQILLIRVLPRPNCVMALTAGWLSGRTTDEHREALADALAQVLR